MATSFGAMSSVAGVNFWDSLGTSTAHITYTNYRRDARDFSSLMTGRITGATNRLPFGGERYYFVGVEQ